MLQFNIAQGGGDVDVEFSVGVVAFYSVELWPHDNDPNAKPFPKESNNYSTVTWKVPAKLAAFELYWTAFDPGKKKTKYTATLTVRQGGVKVASVPAGQNPHKEARMVGGKSAYSDTGGKGFEFI